MSIFNDNSRFIDTFAQPEPESLCNSEWNKSENLFYDDDDCSQPNEKREQRQKEREREKASRNEKEFLTKYICWC